jgi:hypothetical protein
MGATREPYPGGVTGAGRGPPPPPHPPTRPPRAAAPPRGHDPPAAFDAARSVVKAGGGWRVRPRDPPARAAARDDERPAEVPRGRHRLALTPSSDRPDLTVNNSR